jgi:hypothetical protein
MHKHYSNFGNNLKINTNINQDRILKIAKLKTILSANLIYSYFSKASSNHLLVSSPF